MAATTTEEDQPAHRPVMVLALVMALVPWVWLEYTKAINPDIFWLTTGAGRYLHGMGMADGIYDPNPPLSIIVYIPAYLLSRCGISMDLAIITTTAAYLFAACLAVYSLARRLAGRETAMIVTISFLLAGTTLCTAEFGQRDQMVAFSLMPFVLGQLILTRRMACSRLLLNGVFITGSILILLKPHFGLVPAVFLIQRGFVQKRWSIIRDPDFVMLALCSILYVVAIWFLFHDYAIVIFPDVLKLYLPSTHSMVVVVYSAILALIYLDIFGLSYFMERRKGITNPLTRVMIVCAFLCIVPYLVQMKDFKYHLVPSLTFFWTGLGLLVFKLVRRATSPGLSGALMIGILSAAGYVSEPPLTYMTSAQATSQPLTRLVSECGSDCRFIMLDEVVRTMLTTERYSGKESVSRFPSLWFLPTLVTMSEGAERDRLFHKYARFLAEDISKGRPDLLITCNQRFDYVEYFSHDKDFAEAMQPYSIMGTVSVDYVVYYPEAPPGLLKKYECQTYRRGEAGR